MAITLAGIQGKVRSGRPAEAEELLRVFLSELFSLDIASVAVREDTLSLNSVNGFVTLAAPEPKTGAAAMFFKFHHEENEESLAEYYNSVLLSEAGFPVETPLFVSREVGRQVLLYGVKTSERMADICKRTESAAGSPEVMNKLLTAQARLDELCCERYISSLHEATSDQLEEEPVLQLFYYRLVDGRASGNNGFGGRYARFYAGKTFELPGPIFLSFEDLCLLKWRVNGVLYEETLGHAFSKAVRMLSPAAHGIYPAVTAHGDAHNGNVWYDEDHLSLFDPAFAGRHIPALLAEIKPTFHNIFAHPLWLYDAREFDERLDISVSIANGYIEVDHNWSLPVLREEFLRIKRDTMWIPLLRTLKEKNLLPAQWQEYMRAALFCCPTLVMNLRAHTGTVQNSHTPKTSLLALAISVMMSSPPLEGHDIVSDLFSTLDNNIGEQP